MKSKKRAEFISIKVKCVCGKVGDLTGNETDFTGCDDECEMCGSHGRVTVGFVCPKCKKYHDIELSSW